MFGHDLRQRVETLETVVAVMARNQRTMAESLQAIVASANRNAANINENFTAIVSSLEEIIERLAEDRSDDWWREPHD